MMAFSFGAAGLPVGLRFLHSYCSIDEQTSDVVESASRLEQTQARFPIQPFVATAGDNVDGCSADYRGARCDGRAALVHNHAIRDPSSRPTMDGNRLYAQAQAHRGRTTG
jgi:hypothetical protein